MNIIILCDQTSCKFNSKQTHFVGKDEIISVDRTICTHLNPNLGSWSPINNCRSKKDSMLAAINDHLQHPSCDVCETPTPENCLNCCHKSKLILT
jgi:hypothetical protein